MISRSRRADPRCIVLVLLALALACGNPEVVAPPTTPPATASASPPPEQAAYKVGLLTSLTGPYANRGPAARAAAQLAATELNAAGGPNGRALQLLVEDDAGDASQAVMGVKNLANEDVVALLGPTSSVAAVAVLPVEDEASLPAISLSSDQAQFEPAHASVYGVAPDPRVVAAGLVSYLSKSNLHRIGVIRETSAYGTAGIQQLQQQGTQHGVHVVLDETYAINDTDFSRQLGNVKNNPSVEALLVWASDGTAAPATITRQFRQLGLAMPVVLTVDQADPKFLQAAQSSAEGVILEARKPDLFKYLLPNDPSRQALSHFLPVYKHATGSDADRYAAMAYDSVYLLAAALSQAGAAPDGLVAALDRTRFDGVAGPYAFSSSDHAGVQLSALAMATVRHGELVPVLPNCDGCTQTTVDT